MTSSASAVASHPPVMDSMEAIRFLLVGSLTEKPKRGKNDVLSTNDLAWAFVAGSDFQPVPVRTYATPEQKMKAGAVYFTPNTFYHRKKKDKNSLRWLNSFFVDIDDPEITLPDVLDEVNDAGLPEPTVANKTPHGWHVYWALKRVRATPKALKMYETLQGKIVTAIGADPKAASAEHFMRIPCSIQYYTSEKYSLQDFVDWADINFPEWRTEKRSPVVTAGPEIMSHPAIQILLQGVGEGRRNNTCFTLALAMKCAGYSQDQTFRELTAWNFLNQPPMPLSHIRACVRSAYSGKYHAPSARAISELSGVEFRHRVIRPGGSSSDDGGSKRGPYRTKEETREKFVQWLQEHGGHFMIKKGQQQIADEIGVARRTLCDVIADMKKEGILKIETKRLGHGRHEMTYTLLLENGALESTGQGENRVSKVSTPEPKKDSEKKQIMAIQTKVVDLGIWKSKKHKKHKDMKACRDP